VAATATDHLSDVLATSGVLIGLVGAQLGYPVLDPIARLGGGVILYHAFRIVRDNTFILLGGAPSQETVSSIIATLSGVSGVLVSTAPRYEPPASVCSLIPRFSSTGHFRSRTRMRSPTVPVTVSGRRTRLSMTWWSMSSRTHPSVPPKAPTH